MTEKRPYEEKKTGARVRGLKQNKKKKRREQPIETK